MQNDIKLRQNVIQLRQNAILLTQNDIQLRQNAFQLGQNVYNDINQKSIALEWLYQDGNIPPPLYHDASSF